MEIRHGCILGYMNGPLPKIWYVPGMISLLCLPIVWASFIKAPTYETVIKVRIPFDKKDDPLAFTASNFLHYLKNTDITTFYLDGDKTSNQKKLAVFQQEARRIKYTGRGNEALRIHITDDLSYGELVAVFNQMLEDDQKLYALLDNDFYLLGERNDEPPLMDVPLLLCGFMELAPDPPAPTFWKFLAEANAIFINNWILIIAFILLIIAPALIYAFLTAL